MDIDKSHRLLDMTYRQRIQVMFLASPHTALLYPMYNVVGTRPDIVSVKTLFDSLRMNPISYVSAVLDFNVWASNDTINLNRTSPCPDNMIAAVYVSFQTKEELDRFINAQDSYKILGQQLAPIPLDPKKIKINRSVHTGPNQYVYNCYDDGVVQIKDAQYAIIGCIPVVVDKPIEKLSHPKIGLKLLKEKTCDHPLPTYATSFSSGFDLHACLTEEVLLQPGETKLIPSGIRLAIQVGYEVQIRSRSGLTLKSGIVVANSPATIDADFKGSLGIILHNHSEETFEIWPGMKVAQAVLCPVVQANFELVTEETYHAHFVDSNRTGGFGSTGL